MPLALDTQVIDQTFDYIVIGAGAAGLQLAIRLSENPNNRVLVLEAGRVFEGSEPFIEIPGGQMMVLENPDYTWGHQTVTFLHPIIGKGVGGSTVVNFLSWSIPDSEDINDWQRLGNKGWNWDRYSNALKRVSTFTPREVTSPEYQHKPLENWKADPGTGPIQASFPTVLHAEPETLYHQTLAQLGFSPAEDPINGKNSGYAFHPNSVQPSDHTRSYIGKVYQAKYLDSPNLFLRPNSYVTKVELSQDEDGEYSAQGVEFRSSNTDDSRHFIKASKEVIVCAGALKTPQILELSGIGSKDILDKIGIPVKVDLPVGENVQDHVFAACSFELRDDAGFETPDVMVDPNEAAKNMALHPQGKGLFNMGLTNFAYCPLSQFSPRATEINANVIKSVEESIADGKHSEPSKTSLELAVQRPQRDAIDRELVFSFGTFFPLNPPKPGKKYVTLAAMINHPLSRGTIHCTSADPSLDPEFDPRYLTEKCDLEGQIEAVKFLRSLVRKEPMKKLFEDENPVELNPGAEYQTDEQLGEWVRKAIQTVYHTIGSASMLPREKGGVVDSNLKVYGCKNLRVADLSIVPIHFSAHSQATAYVVGEIAAEIIGQGAEN